MKSPYDGLQGGAISYAAAVASAYGIRACVVTAAGPDADLSVFRGHDLHVVPTNNTLTFEHSYTWWGKILNPHLHVLCLLPTFLLPMQKIFPAGASHI